MPLPDKVIEQLGREPAKTPGWAFGATMFSGGLLFIAVLIYFGLTLGYEPYLSGQIQQQNDQINQLGQSISPDDQAKLLNFYSQISNLRTIIRSHAATSQVLAWLEKNTEANVSYQSFGLTPDHQIALTATAKAEADINQQIAIFESSPQVQRVNVSAVAPAQNTAGWQFNLTLVMDPTLFTAGSATITSATTTATSTTR